MLAADERGGLGRRGADSQVERLFADGGSCGTGGIEWLLDEDGLAAAFALEMDGLGLAERSCSCRLGMLLIRLGLYLILPSASVVWSSSAASVTAGPASGEERRARGRGRRGWWWPGWRYEGPLSSGVHEAAAGLAGSDGSDGEWASCCDWRWNA